MVHTDRPTSALVHSSFVRSVASCCFLFIFVTFRSCKKWFMNEMFNCSSDGQIRGSFAVTVAMFMDVFLLCRSTIPLSDVDKQRKVANELKAKLGHQEK